MSIHTYETLVFSLRPTADPTKRIPICGITHPSQGQPYPPRAASENDDWILEVSCLAIDDIDSFIALLQTRQPPDTFTPLSLCTDMVIPRAAYYAAPQSVESAHPERSRGPANFVRAPCRVYPFLLVTTDGRQVSSPIHNLMTLVAASASGRGRRKNLATSLTHVSSALGVDILNEGAPILGSISVIRPTQPSPLHVARPTPTTARITAGGDLQSRRIVICHLSGNPFAECVAHKSIILHPGQSTADITTDRAWTACDIELFDHDSGALIASDRIHLFLPDNMSVSVHIGAEVVPPQRWHGDITSEVISHTCNPWAAAPKQLRYPRLPIFESGASLATRFFEQAWEASKALSPTGPNSAVFLEKGPVGESQSEIIRLVSQARGRVTIIDPFFTTEALVHLFGRGTAVTGNVRIVTSLHAKHSDTSDALRSKCQELSDLLPNPFSLINVRRGNEQAFHDRYLMIERKNCAPEVFFLSNSLNAMTRRWPLCVARVPAQISVEIADYLTALATGSDPMDPQVSLDVETVWSTGDWQRAMRDSRRRAATRDEAMADTLGAFLSCNLARSHEGETASLKTLTAAIGALSDSIAHLDPHDLARLLLAVGSFIVNNCRNILDSHSEVARLLSQTRAPSLLVSHLVRLARDSEIIPCACPASCSAPVDKYAIFRFATTDHDPRQVIHSVRYLQRHVHQSMLVSRSLSWAIGVVVLGNPSLLDSPRLHEPSEERNIFLMNVLASALDPFAPLGHTDEQIFLDRSLPFWHYLGVARMITEQNTLDPGIMHTICYASGLPAPQKAMSLCAAGSVCQSVDETSFTIEISALFSLIDANTIEACLHILTHNERLFIATIHASSSFRQSARDNLDAVLCRYVEECIKPDPSASPGGISAAVIEACALPWTRWGGWRDRRGLHLFFFVRNCRQIEERASDLAWRFSIFGPSQIDINLMGRILASILLALMIDLTEPSEHSKRLLTTTVRVALNALTPLANDPTIRSLVDLSWRGVWSQIGHRWGHAQTTLGTP